MSTFERADQLEIEAALERQATPEHHYEEEIVTEFHPELRLVDPTEPEKGWERIGRIATTPFVRHINRQRGGQGWTDPPKAA